MTVKRLGLIGGAAAFCLVAVLNSGGYRYGIGDQAFYIPAVVQHVDPGLFPRDRVLLHAQDRFMVFDDLLASASRVTGASVPVLFFAAYVLSLVLLYCGLVAIGETMYRSWLAIAVLVALATLRHRITQTGANSLESYFQPRLMAFSLGVWAIAAVLRSRTGRALLLAAIACALHPTTGMWFAIWIIVATAVSEKAWRPAIAGVVAVGAAGAIWMVTIGPLRGHFVRVDPTWTSVMAGKDYIFPSDWGPAFWLVNFGYLIVSAAAFLLRKRRGLALPAETGVLIGAATLSMIFLLSWPLMTARIALALQLQTSRVFWMLDLLAAISIAWLVGEGIPPRFAKGAAIVLVGVAIARGVFVLRAEHSGAAIVRIGLPHDNWNDAMSWIAKTPRDTHILADPGHAWKYGSSVRVAAERDVLVEEVKDAAIALYSRDVAMWVLGRLQDTQHFDSLSPEQFRALSGRYDLDYLVIDRNVELPLAYRNDQFRIYQLRTIPQFRPVPQ